ncbi:uncharacterized protein METZ01_LOCUS191746, partial [marine metagenome]
MFDDGIVGNLRIEIRDDDVGLLERVDEGASTRDDVEPERLAAADDGVFGRIGPQPQAGLEVVAPLRSIVGLTLTG